MTLFPLSFLDWFIFFILQVVTVLFVLYGEKLKQKSTILEYLLMGRQLTLPLFVGTLVSSWYGGIFGVTQIAFEQGVYNFVTQGVFWYVTYIIFAFFLVKKIRKFDAVTLPEILGKMFGPKSSKIGAILNFINILPIAYCISLGILLQTLFGGSLSWWIATGTIFMLTYSFYGGLRSVVFSDFFQFFMMCLAVFLVILFAFGNFGGINYLQSHLPASHFDWRGGEDYLSIFAWGLIACATLVDPNFYQRVLAAKDEKVAIRGILISTIIWIMFDLCTTLGGMYARAALPNANPAQGYFQFAMQILPNGFKGLFLAGALATIISTLSAFMNIAGITVSYDLLPAKWRNKIWLHRLCYIFVGTISITLALFFNGQIKLAWKTMGSFASGCLLAPMLFTFWRPGKITDWQFTCSAFCGSLSIILGKLCFDWPYDRVYLGIIGSVSVLITWEVFKKLKQFS